MARRPYSVAVQTAGASHNARGPYRASRTSSTNAKIAGNSARYITSSPAIAVASGTLKPP